MIKSNQGSSARIVAAILCSMLVIILILYIRQTNQYSTLLRLHHGSQTSLQEKIIDIARLKNELKVKDSQCTAELESLDKEADACDTKSKTMKAELEESKKKVTQFESQSGENDASRAAEREKYIQVQEQLKTEADTCTSTQEDLERKLRECVTKLEVKEVETKVKDKEVETKKPESDVKLANKSVEITVDEIAKSLEEDTLKVDDSESMHL